MLSPAMNERLTRVGPGTPGGELMRRYWIPIAPYAQLDENPVRKVRILGEDLVLYRDKSGTLGLIGDRCLHRNVDLRFGVPDESGLRCPYHGWLFNSEGKCIERPMEATPCGEIKQKLKGYPVRELGGLVFAYMGPLPAPDLPRWDLFVWPNAIRQIAITVLNCNWLQCQENTGDPAHSAWAHGHMFEYAISRQKGFDHHSADQLHTLHQRKRVGVGIKELYAEPYEFGFRKGIRYSKALGADEDKEQEHSAVIFPFYTQTGGSGTPRSEYQIRVPIDDTHTYHICYQCYAAPEQVPVPEQKAVPYYVPPQYDENGDAILDYVLAQDAIVWVAQGPITDRSAELLGRTDLPIVLLRRQLDEQIKRVEDGLAPINTFSTSPDMLHPTAGKAASFHKHAFRKYYHRGFGIDDADRYGPLFETVKDLHRRIEEFDVAQVAAAASTEGTPS
jgi:5,5'-dehydrodivanillate O-demethylase oxygenase subunit